MEITNWLGALQSSLLSSITEFMTFLPNLLGALVLLLLGWAGGRLVALTLSRVLRLVGMDRFLAQTAMHGLLERAGIRRPASALVGALGFWVVFLLFCISAAEVLRLTVLSGALTTLAFYLPQLGIAILVLVMGYVAANLLREAVMIACRSAGIAHGHLIAQALFLAALLVIVVTAINQLGLDTTLLNTAILLVVGGLVAGASLSFGLGARQAVANLIAAHYLQPVLRVGQQLKVGELQGTVVDLTPVAVILDTEQGRVIMPAAQLTESAPVITSSDG